MSVEYYLACHECKKRLNIACHGFSGFQFPFLDVPLMKAMKEFLGHHSLCDGRVTFVPEQREAEDYEEIQVAR